MICLCLCDVSLNQGQYKLLQKPNHWLKAQELVELEIKKLEIQKLNVQELEVKENKIRNTCQMVILGGKVWMADTSGAGV